MEKFRQMFNRAQLENAEVAMLRVLTQMEWALSKRTEISFLAGIYNYAPSM